MIPVIVNLGNKDLKVRHWQKIFALLGQQYTPEKGNKNFELREIIGDAMEKKEQIEEISGRASGEAGIEQQVEEIKKKWQELSFVV